jgi:hypothetical protein
MIVDNEVHIRLPSTTSTTLEHFFKNWAIGLKHSPTRHMEFYFEVVVCDLRMVFKKIILVANCILKFVNKVETFPQ